MVVQGIKDKVVCQAIEQEHVTEGGLFIPETAQAQQPNLTCKVLSVGEDVTEVKPDDIIFCHRSGGMDMVHKTVIYKILKSDEIYAVLK